MSTSYCTNERMNDEYENYFLFHYLYLIAPPSSCFRPSMRTTYGDLNPLYMRLVILHWDDGGWLFAAQQSIDRAVPQHGTPGRIRLDYDTVSGMSAS